MMIISIHQPSYLPWLGYFEKMALSELFVILDTVQFEKNSFDNRNKIRTSKDWCWLTVPVKTKGKFQEMNWQNLEIQNQINWRRKHFSSIKANYGRSPFWSNYAEELECIYDKHYERLLDINLAFVHFFRRHLGITTPLVFASDMQLVETKSNLVLEILVKLKATAYYSGALGRDYLELETFSKNGIDVEFQNYWHPEYEQRFPGFVPYMSTLDLLLSKGDESREVILNHD